MNMEFERKIAIPMEVKEMFPIDAEVQTIVEKKREEIKKIISGKDDRILLVIGPCSADREDAVLDYILRLKGVQEKVGDKIFIVPRVYTNKPRTTGDGYKGLLHEPVPGEKPDLFKGIITTRELHMRAVKETGFACADEMLYPENYKYLDDILGYVTVGARSVEDQQHRLTASAVEAAIGMKNPTSGDLSVMMNSIHAAQKPHTFLYRGWAGHSAGNEYAHAILRGFNTKGGQTFPNYHYEDVMYLHELYERSDLKNPAVVIDTNHANSNKNPFEQVRIIGEVMSYRKFNADAKKIVKGFMVESYIEDGNQQIGEGIYGKSITDACLGWEKTEKMIYDLAEMV
ncbi:MAG: 3-deoxy-7-phosphoheptulonate synthase [Lachnospiraceae bacterium]|nr:3-deoxy-7-phosphoheptulonate synthase [Lachnospiraceae bacterium]